MNQNNNDIDEFKRIARHQGFVIPEYAKFWRVRDSGKYSEFVGMEVGRYCHSCHVDTTDLIVLLFIDLGGDSVYSFSDFWLTALN